MDVRLATCLIIRKGHEYLVGRSRMTGELIWKTARWDAWSTRDRKAAETVVKNTGGELILFNRETGDIREYRAEE